jgi:maleylacetate reductase
MKKFDFRAPSWNIVFGAGAFGRTPQLLDELGFRRPLILSTPGRAAEVATLKRMLAGTTATFMRAAVHVPAAMLEEARLAARAVGTDCTISIGGGSTTGLGKALRLRDGLPHVAIPTTYAGSEMTSLWGITENKVKQTGRDPGVIPSLVIYDPELLVRLPLAIAAPSALNAIAQAAANLPGFNDDPIPNVFAREAIAVLGPNLPRLVRSRPDVQMCSELLYGACLAGAALGTGRTGLHHRICHVLGGMFNLAHADTHAVILPYSIAFNRNAVPEAARLLAGALAVEDPAEALYELMRLACRKPSLRELGLSGADLDAAAAAVIATPVASPVVLTRESVRCVLQDAFEGKPPRG